MTGTPIALLDDPGALRLLDANEAPYGGRLHAGDPQTVWVDARDVPDLVWRFEVSGHVLAPWDVARTRDGHAAILPHCPRRLRDVDAGGRAGAIVTIAVSMIRAAQEARMHGADTGEWWIDADGRPVLAVGGSRAWADEAGEIIEGLAVGAGPLLRRALDDASRLMAARRVADEDVVQCEERLFAVAEPAALHDASIRSDAFTALLTGEPVPRRADSLNGAVLADTAETWLGRFTDAEWASRVTGAVRSVGATSTRVRGMWSRERERRVAARRRRTSRRDEAREGHAREGRVSGRDRGDAHGRGRAPSRRRAPWAVAAAVGVVVIIAGLAWPDAGASPSDRDANAAEVGSHPAEASPTASASASASAQDEASFPPGTEGARASGDDHGEPSAQPTGGADPAAGARVALTALRDCASVDACGQVFETPGRALPEGVVAHATDATQVTLLDEYGGIAVLRIEDGGRAAQILVMVSKNGKWLVRDVYDVADQP
ncbi:hypothetical protein [Microbacterium dextranolyticum]|uniref:Uncharacterized protein n=1 Tax=Microbacterium dextranolyticum TaxID=36806 RepID=A0A9W6HND6_9MICO|nr:hypothetical protein [Microbacterium dextranolyticum]MBM7462973.1 hypothetical protein [Microbacterium dextranolyticum]GLJ95921.1 hypothetical protein GCM10017591_19840 [Microbacterium dextranolyticum]